MANDGRHTRADLTGASDFDQQVAEMDFFELLRRLETSDLRFGRAGTAAREPARLGQSPRLAFAASDVAKVTPGTEDAPPSVAVNVIGLIGPEGPMPLHLTRWILQRLSNRWFSTGSEGALADTSFLEFVNILQHRMIALYWRAWADTRPEIDVGLVEGGRVTAILRALAGIGLPGETTKDQRLDSSKLHHATSLAQSVRSPERLSHFLETLLDVPVSIKEFIGHWIEIPEALQSRLGRQYCGLGDGAVLGARVFDRQSKFEVCLGPLTLSELSRFLRDQDTWTRLKHALVFAMGRDMAFQVRLVLRSAEVPAAQLGSCQLGRTIWLDPKNGRNVDDICFRDIETAFRQPRTERAAPCSN